jgi:hypothetical protein
VRLPESFGVRHQQILDKLTVTGHIRAMDEDLARWVGFQMLGPPKKLRQLEQAVIPPILTRWRCLFHSPDVPAATKNQAWVALATLLHKYGFADRAVTANALRAIDELNEGVVLSDAFARQTDAIKELLQWPAVPLSRRPRQPKAVTFLRVGDVVAIQLDQQFHAAFVLDIHGTNGFPIIEFYAGTFAQPPTAEQLSGRAAAADRGKARFGVVGLTYLPDPARQVTTVATQHPQAPTGTPPGPTDGLYILTDIITLQRNITTLFRNPSHETGSSYADHEQPNATLEA